MRYDTLRGEILIHLDNRTLAVLVHEQGVKLSRKRYENVCKGDGAGPSTRYPGNNFNYGRNVSKISAYCAFRNFSGEGAKGADKVHFYKGHGASHALLESKEVDFCFSVVPLRWNRT